jgi:acylphosphatase
MKKCVKITFHVPLKKGFLNDFVQHTARSLGLEGVAHPHGADIVKIVAFGDVAAIDDLVDILHKESVKYAITQIEIEPFLKDRDYRGIFRVIE